MLRRVRCVNLTNNQHVQSPRLIFQSSASQAVNYESFINRNQRATKVIIQRERRNEKSVINSYKSTVRLMTASAGAGPALQASEIKDTSRL